MRHWQAEWERTALYQTDVAQAERPFYNLMMFPYPSAEGLHVGTCTPSPAPTLTAASSPCAVRTASSRWASMRSASTAQNFAIQLGIHPRVLTAQNVERFRETQ